MGELGAVCFIPDCHVPFEDLKSYEIAMEILLYVHDNYDLKEIVLLGDFIDIYGLSFHEKDPSFGDLAELYDREMSIANERLDFLDDHFEGVKKVYLEGNHEFRLKRFLNRFAGPLRNRLSVPGELGLNSRPSWKWVRFGRQQIHKVWGCELYARHCPFSSAQALRQAELAGRSFIHGHTHQTQQATISSKIDGTEITAISSGCLVNFQHHVFDYVPARPNWTHSVTVVLIDQKTGSFYPHVVRILPDYTAVFDGVRFSR